MSVVSSAVTREDVEECRLIAADLKVRFRVK